ncbi:MAG: FG-GAP repeat protein [Sandaracinaceae bacterium]|nr:FG-GAP repeat protein [Sandaracinaceae bacterium]
MRGRPLWCAALLVVTGCRGEFPVPPELSTTDGVLPRCGEIAAPLSIEPGSATVGAGQLFVLRGRGGTGAYHWSVADNRSGADVDPNAGVYVAGSRDPDVADTQDVILLEDRGCDGEASAIVTVVDAPRILPARVALEPAERLMFRGEGGSGTYTFELALNASGGSITPDGAYVAGARIGRDIVRLTDTLLESSAEAMVDVVLDGSVSLSPPEWVIPVGSSAALPTRGGSGEYDVAVTGGLEHVAGTTVRATAPGAGTVTFTDRYTGRTAMARVTTVAPHDASRALDGDRAETHVVRSGDVDGDGDDDVVVGMESHSGDYFASGVVLVFLNEGGTIGPEPARVLSGHSRDEEFGTDVQLADIDADGFVDLLVGARRADPIRVDVGAVYVYGGLEGGVDEDGAPFTRAPVRSFFGNNSFDLFGDSIAVCDFNGDGRLDLAASAPFGQDPDGLRDQGVVHVFLAYPNGRFLSAPDVQIFGLGVDAMGAVAPIESMRLGEGIAAGDFDGDGVCDLAAYAVMGTEGTTDSGAVFLYRGRPVMGSDRGGPEAIPRLIWTRADSVDDNARFGEDVLLGDVNGDGLADLVATRYLHDGADGVDSGAIYARYGRAFGEPATGITDIDAGADWSFEGLASDRVGNAAALFDVDGDARLDLISGDSRAEVMDGMIDRPGMIRVFLGGGDLPARPELEVEGLVSGERFGLGVGAVADADGDGRAELIAFAPYHDTVEGMNDDRGALYLASSRGGITELTVPRHPSGQLVGFSTAWLGDLNGDGFPELAVGSPRTDAVGPGRNLGTVRIYAGTAAGTASAPSQELAGFTTLSEGDEVGWQVARAGDFDGDSIPDLLVLSRNEDIPDTLAPETWTPVGACARRDNPGTVYVFRGQADGTVADEPMLLYHGPFANQRNEDVIGGLDVNGDGLDDLVVGGREWDPGGVTNAGGVGVVFGRAPTGDGTIWAVCDADVEFDGTTEGARLGEGLVALGDLNADGCDDFAAGAPEADPRGVNNAGEVVVFFGFDASAAMRCGPETSFTRTTLFGTDRDAQGGFALGGGVNLFGDGAPDLLIGAPRYRDGRGEVGRVVLVDGARLVANVGGTIPFVDAASGAELVLDGQTAGERFGTSLDAARGASGALVVIGGPFGASSGIVNTGGAGLYRVGASGFVTAQYAQVAGETLGESNLGGAVSLTFAGGRAYVAIGAPNSGSVELDDGASYAFTLTP